jgi:hypothetical protein
MTKDSEPNGSKHSPNLFGFLSLNQNGSADIIWEALTYTM